LEEEGPARVARSLFSKDGKVAPGLELDGRKRRGPQFSLPEKSEREGIRRSAFAEGEIPEVGPFALRDNDTKLMAVPLQFDLHVPRVHDLKDHAIAADPDRLPSDGKNLIAHLKSHTRYSGMGCARNAHRWRRQIFELKQTSSRGKKRHGF